MELHMHRIKTLFLASNPEGTNGLKLDEEIRAITDKIRAAEHRDLIELVSAWAVRPDDLIQTLNEHKPQIVHFSGHGNKEGEIILMDNDRSPKPVTVIALRALFSALRDNIRIVLLNACYSEIQAKAIVENIDCVIGMNSAIGDDAAIAFAASFYRALGFGRSVKESFEQGKLSLLMEGIPEENTPQLLCKTGVDAESLYILNDNDNKFNQKISLPDYPYQRFSASFRDVVAPKRYDDYTLNLVFGSLSDIQETTVVIPINQDFDFGQRGPRSVLASFEKIQIGDDYFFNFLEKSWSKNLRPSQAGIGHTEYIRLPANSQSLNGVMFVVTTRNISNSPNHYGRYTKTPIEGIDYILDKVMQKADDENISSIALPLLGTGYANVDIARHPELRLFISELVLALTIQKLEENFTQQNRCLKRGIITIFSNQPQGQEEHHIWDFTIRLLNKEHSKRAEQIQKLIEDFNQQRDILISKPG